MKRSKEARSDLPPEEPAQAVCLAAGVDRKDFARLALHGDGYRAAAHRAVLNVLMVSLRRIEHGFKDFAAPRAINVGCLEIVHV